MRYNAEIITIGSELLKGSVLNTNAQFLGRELNRLGFYVSHQGACDDVSSEINLKLNDALSRSDVIIMCGGLGPTPDDVTRDAIADHFGVALEFSKTQYAQISKYYKRRKQKVPSIVKKEASFPSNAKPLVNKHGIALGFYILTGPSVIIVLPGVPSELQKMFRELVTPLLKKEFRGMGTQPQLVIKIVGQSEPEVMKKLKKDFFDEEFEFGIYPDFGEVTLRIQASQTRITKKLMGKAKKRLGKNIFSFQEITLADEVGRLLKKKKKTLSVAESCSGGRLAAEFTKMSGSSQFFKGSLTAYSNEIKKGCLDVPADILKKHGAVSDEVAKLLAKNIRLKMKSTYGIGITGVAGPNGGTKQKPVGTVHIALATPKKVSVWKRHYWGDRYQVQMRSVKKAIECLWREIT